MQRKSWNIPLEFAILLILSHAFQPDFDRAPTFNAILIAHALTFAVLTALSFLFNPELELQFPNRMLIALFIHGNAAHFYRCDRIGQGARLYCPFVKQGNCMEVSLLSAMPFQRPFIHGPLCPISSFLKFTCRAIVRQFLLFEGSQCLLAFYETDGMALFAGSREVCAFPRLDGSSPLSASLWR